MKFADKVRAARKALNLSRTELGLQIGVSERSVYSYEIDNIIPKRPVLEKMAAVFKVSIGYLLDESETKEQSHFDYDMFIANAKNKYGAKGAREASEVLQKASVLFAGGELEDGAKDLFFQSLSEVYFEAKARAREKFTPKKYRKSQEQPENQG